MIISLKHVESVQGTYPQILKDGIIITKKLNENSFVLIAHFDKDISWNNEIVSGKPYPLLSETEKNINICCNGKLQVFEKDTGNALLVSEENMIYLGDSFFITYERIGEIKGFMKMSCFKFNTDKIEFSWSLEKIKRGLIKDYKNRLFINTEEEIICLDNFSGKELWKIAFNEGIYIPYMVTENQILIILKNKMLISIDLHTGEKQWQCEDIYGINLMLKDGLLYALYGGYYHVIDPKTGEKLFFKDLSELNRANQVFPHAYSCTMSGDYIFFNSDMPVCKLGAFNIKTLEYEWLHQLYPEQKEYNKSLFFKSKVEIHKNNLYVLDSKDTLHIFEREVAAMYQTS